MESARDQAVGTEHTWDRARDTAGRRSAANVRRSSRNSSSALPTSPGRRARRAAASFARPCPADIRGRSTTAATTSTSECGFPVCSTTVDDFVWSDSISDTLSSRKYGGLGRPGDAEFRRDVRLREWAAGVPSFSSFFARASPSPSTRRSRRQCARYSTTVAVLKDRGPSFSQRATVSSSPCPNAAWCGVGGEPAPHKTPTSALIAGRPTVIHLYNGG